MLLSSSWLPLPPFSGCGGVSQLPGPTSLIVTMITPPSLFTSGRGTASVAATVSNDTANAGVNWSCTPSSTLRFLQSSFHRASGVAQHDVYGAHSGGLRGDKLSSWLAHDGQR